MSSSILDPCALIDALPKTLPTDRKRLGSPQDAIASLLHTAMTALGFRLIGVDDSTSTGSYENNQLPTEWNSHGPGSYTFRYRHEQSSLEFILKVSKLGARTMINAIALESDKASSLDIPTGDFTSSSFFPHDLSAPNAQPLIHGFISSNRITDLMSQFQLRIIQKLIPGLQKQGYTEASPAASSSSQALPGRPNNPQPARPQPVSPPSAPDHSDPYGIPTRNPLEIGRSDLSPFPRNPFTPPSLFPDNDGDGMYVGPNHPIFNGQGGLRPPGNRGPFGGDGFLPPMGAPPGARFDPIVPGPFGGLPRRGPRGPGGGFGPGTGEPDSDEFMPPGAGDMFM